MKHIFGLGLSLVLLAQLAAAQSLGELARKERERKAKQEKASVKVTTDQLLKGQVDLSPPFDPSRKGDLDYLLKQLAYPKTTPELLAAFVPLKDQAIPKLLPMLNSPDRLRRVAPATVLIVLGNTQGLGAMGSMLTEATQDAAAPAPTEAEESSKPATESEAALRQRIEAARQADFALGASKLGVWRFTEASGLTPDQVVARLEKGPAIEIVGGLDNGQRVFSRALRDSDPNVRGGTIALIQVAAGGNDFGYRADQASEQNEAAIQRITTFLTTERNKVISQIGAKKR
jgi:hypothetical protein